MGILLLEPWLVLGLSNMSKSAKQIALSVTIMIMMTGDFTALSPHHTRTHVHMSTVCY